jgi:hypothetical protein
VFSLFCHLKFAINLLLPRILCVERLVKFARRDLIPSAFAIDCDEQLSANFSCEHSEPCILSPTVGAVSIAYPGDAEPATGLSTTTERLATIDCYNSTEYSTDSAVYFGSQQPISDICAGRNFE